MVHPDARKTSLARLLDPLTRFVGFHRAEPAWVSPRKRVVQTDFDVWYVWAGAGEVMVNGRWISFGAGDLVTLKPGDIYQRERADPEYPFQVYFVHLLPFGVGRRSHDVRLAKIWPAKISISHRLDLADLFEAYYAAYVTGADPASPRVRGYAFLVLSAILEAMAHPLPPNAPESMRGLVRARQFMKENFRHRLTLSSIAAEASLSSSHFSALFKQHLHVSPIEFLLDVRVREAKLLLGKGWRVKEVAEAAGFDSQHYFARVFKRRTGATPTEFARRHVRQNPFRTL